LKGIADCEQTQTSWYETCARAAGGAVWHDGPLHWVWLPQARALMLMFPTDLPHDGVRRGVEAAKQRQAVVVGAWLGLDVDAGPLAAHDFDRGWSPWWMAARIADLGPPQGTRVALASGVDDVESDEPLRSLITERPQSNWFAQAYVDWRVVGHAWSHHRGEIAGVFDMDVWPTFQRRGLGTELCRAVCGAAATAGSRYAVLNATPQGEKLYRTLGFERVGDGITWWLHLRA
jgi:GNAT superfamily N-acetyltransferase